MIASALQSAIYVVSTALLYPVVVLLLFLVAWVAVELGGFLYELFSRFRSPNRLESGITDAMTAESRSDAVRRVLDSASSRMLHEFLKDLLRLVESDDGGDEKLPVRVEKLLQDYELLATKRLERTRILVRIGPMLGLMGTLIPMGPALLALTHGDVQTLANNLIIAFGTTVVGLLVGGVAFVISTIRERWYSQDLSDMAYVCEMLFGGVGEPV